MKPLTTLLALSTSLTLTSAYWKGFNIGANNPDGSCKSYNDWVLDFQKMQSLDGYFSSARLYASGDCSTLANAVPAALNTNTKLLAGVWAEDNNHYNSEKQALADAIGAHGTDWLIAVSVGNEDLYRGDTSASTLAGQINDVRNMIHNMGHSDIQVGHIDTWTAWVNDGNNDVIRACDWVGTNGFPYFQNTGINDAYNTYFDSVAATRDTVNRVKPGIWVWMTETGWPVSGNQMGAAVASQSNLQQYWSSVACAAFQQGHTFWYSLQDYNSSPSFGILDGNLNPIINTHC
ncbi:MAG: hypothetical protein M1812_006768 [Candelaria pacifica]|nr:MAG: hypothetical protein M1812_006768 [Candelaria pacifica]